MSHCLSSIFLIPLQLFDMVVESEDVSDEQKARICKKFGEADKVLIISNFYSCIFRFFFFLIFFSI